jgi:hypothetical protein
MRVLVLEGERGAADEAAMQLAESGYEVARCHDPGAAPFPCKGMVDDEKCPLDHEHVDVAVVIRREAGGEPVAGEDGVRCALRRYIPLVVAGDVSASPYVDWAAVVQEGTDGLADAVTDAALAPLRRHADAARRSFRAVLEHHGVDAALAEAHVRRVGPDLHITLRTNTSLDKTVSEMASVRAVGAVRDVDPYPRVIDVSVES